jgi:predicted ABC-class ATPase
MNENYYNKFLNKNNIEISNNKIDYNNNEEEFSNSFQQPPNISNITFENFIKQTGQMLSKDFNLVKQLEKKNKTPNKNKLKSKYINKNLFKNNNNNNKNKINSKENKKLKNIKKKEFYEEIIKANSKAIREENPFLENYNDNKNKSDNEIFSLEPKKFLEENLNQNNEINLHLFNEIENKRQIIEKKHKEIINKNLPEILNDLNKLLNENEFYFIKNKYEDILKEYS